MTEMVIAIVSTRMPRKTMEVVGGESFSEEVINPRSRKRSSRARKAAADLVGVSAPPEIVNVICTRVAELLVHIGDSGSGCLARHCRGAKAERRSDVEVEVITVLVPQEMMVTGSILNWR